MTTKKTAEELAKDIVVEQLGDLMSNEFLSVSTRSFLVVRIRQALTDARRQALEDAARVADDIANNLMADEEEDEHVVESQRDTAHAIRNCIMMKALEEKAE